MKNSRILNLDIDMLWLADAEAVEMDDVCLGSSDIIQS